MSPWLGIIGGGLESISTHISSVAELRKGIVSNSGYLTAVWLLLLLAIFLLINT
jgi:hypothetical protein